MSHFFISGSQDWPDMVLLDNSSFILQLEKIACAARQDSSFKITFKRFDGQNKPIPRNGNSLKPETEHVCLMRARSKSKKISTVVRQEDVPRMMTMYAQFMKGKLDGLKRVKKPKSKAKATKG